MMNNTPACAMARNQIEEMNKMLLCGKVPTVKEMYEYITTVCFHRQLTDNNSVEDWKDYNNSMYNTNRFTYKTSISNDKLECWVQKVGQHWTKEQTTNVAKQNDIDFTEFTECEFYAIMNIAYSDFGDVFKDVSVYVNYSKCWLIDNDSYCPNEKLARYYEYIVKH